MLHSWVCTACAYRFKTFRSKRHKVRCPLCRTDELPKRDYTEERGMTLPDWAAGIGFVLLLIFAASLDGWMM